MTKELHRIYINRPTCHPIMKMWTQGWHYIREMRQQWNIKEMLANVLTQIRVSDVFIM